MLLLQIDQEKFQSILIRAIVLPLLLMIGLAGILLWQIDKLLSAFQMVENTDEVIAQGYDILTLISDRETGMRGYLLTANPVFLEPYKRADSVIESKFNEFGQMVKGVSSDLDKLAELRALSKQWESYARDEIDLRSRGEDYLVRVARGEGKQLTDAMRSKLVSIIQARKELLDVQSKTAKRSTQMVIGTCIGLTFLLGSILALLTRRQLITISQSYGHILDERTKLLVQEQAARTKAEQAEQVRFLLLERIISAQEQERELIARELHDEAGQSLTSLLVGLSAIERMQTVDEILEHAKDLREVTVQTLSNLRRLARGLHPSILQDLGLITALTRYAEDYTKFHGVTVNVQTNELKPCRYPMAVEITIYRITQEALTNIAKYAAAKTVNIILERQPEGLSLIINDDGCGFDEDRVLKSNISSNHLGLYSIRERVTFLGGSFLLKSELGNGTSIFINIPLQDQPTE